MTGYVTDQRLSRTLNLPISLPETELRAGKSILVCTLTLVDGQCMHINSLTLKIVQLLTVGVLPVKIYDAYGIASVGVYPSGSDATPIAYASSNDNTPYTSNPFCRHTIDGPGSYDVVVRNNTSNINLAVNATGTAKIHY